MRNGPFPPFGFVSSEFGLCALVLQLFCDVLGFSDFKTKMASMDIHGIQFFNFFSSENQRTPKNSCKTSAQSPNSLDTNPKGGNGPLRIFLAYAQEIHFLSTKCLLDFGQGCNIWRNHFLVKFWSHATARWSHAETHRNKALELTQRLSMPPFATESRVDPKNGHESV